MPKETSLSFYMASKYRIIFLVTAFAFFFVAVYGRTWRILHSSKNNENFEKISFAAANECVVCREHVMQLHENRVVLSCCCLYPYAAGKESNSILRRIS